MALHVDPAVLLATKTDLDHEHGRQDHIRLGHDDKWPAEALETSKREVTLEPGSEAHGAGPPAKPADWPTMTKRQRMHLYSQGGKWR